MRFLNFYVAYMVQKYQNESAPIFYYGKSPKTNIKHLKIPYLEALALGYIIKMTLYNHLELITEPPHLLSPYPPPVMLHLWILTQFASINYPSLTLQMPSMDIHQDQRLVHQLSCFLRSFHRTSCTLVNNQCKNTT